MNSVVWLILDSCRYDSFVRAKTPNFDRFLAAIGGEVERRFSYASFTAPAHHVFLMGLVPHASPPGVFAGEVYQRELAKWSWRLGVNGLDFRHFLPRLSLPSVLRSLGYRTIARVSLPVLNEATLLATDFDDYRLMPHYASFAAMIDELEFPADGPRFYFLNLGETHYPYLLDDDRWPRLSGLHGAVRSLAANAAIGPPTPFAADQLRELHDQQVRCVEHVDELFGRLLPRCPPGTHLIVTADHGELFGEDGYFGHGPVMHEKVFEVPFFEGQLSPSPSSDVPPATADAARDKLLEQLRSLGYA